MVKRNAMLYNKIEVLSVHAFANNSIIIVSQFIHTGAATPSLEHHRIHKTPSIHAIIIELRLQMIIYVGELND